jgi:hypothetical protein
MELVTLPERSPRRVDVTAPRETVAELLDVLAVDAELAETVAPTGPRPRLPAVALRLEAGRWLPPRKAESSALGLLIVGGVLLRRSIYGGCCCCELLGPGDLVRPWVEDVDALLPAEVEWQVIQPVRLAVLNGRAAQLCAANPAVVGELLDRALIRARRRATLSAISGARRIEDRLVLLLGHLAARWGRVNSNGILVEVPLTHALLADLVGARRPSVTSALTNLRAAGLVERVDEGWLLTRLGQDQVEAKTSSAIS